jgi:P27 family predicted phage terminase small subunit
MKRGPKPSVPDALEIPKSAIKLEAPDRYKPGQPQAARWDEVIARLEALGVADGVDQKLVERYVDTLYIRDRTLAAVNKIGLTYEIFDRTGHKIKDAANPAVRQHAQTCESLLRMESELCLSPAARLRAGRSTGGESSAPADQKSSSFLKPLPPPKFDDGDDE